MNFFWKTFDTLSTKELYAILALREQVFMLEQQSLYRDIDGLDRLATHLLCYEASELIGYLRLAILQDKITIGRVVVAKHWRGKGIGVQLLTIALDKASREYAPLSIHLSAQVSSQALYSRLGFQAVSEPYDDGGIAHVDMLKAPVA